MRQRRRRFQYPDWRKLQVVTNAANPLSSPQQGGSAVKRHRDKEWELAIGPDTVRLFILKAKALSAAVNDDYADGAEHEVEFDGDRHDRHGHDGLAEEKTEDLTEKELRELIGDLNVDEAAELVALAWIGRGDYDASEWADALAAARERPHRRTAKYLLGMPTLADWLEEGLEAIGA
jgi:hypothetical protein